LGTNGRVEGEAGIGRLDPIDFRAFDADLRETGRFVIVQRFASRGAAH
jgi:hypothetical protein